MISLNLSQWMSLEIYRALLVFIRIGAAMLLLPGYGEPSVPVRIRILVGVAIAAAVSANVADMPQLVPGAGGIVKAVAAEAMAGALLGTLGRTLISAILVAGQVIGQNIGLSNVFATGVTIDQSATAGAAIYAGILAILFASGAHHLILRGLIESYRLLPPGQFPNTGASARVVVAAGARAFRLAGQIALPFLLLSLLFNASLAVMNRALPAIPVFQIANPALVVLGLYLLAATVPGILDPGLADWADLAGMMR
ncbi:MAG TPA: flagellar biosynthetic protein FliR [Acetobacteraceae bacterium]|jgi:flagellar biosynthesis protein FliR|nr:flagellar biosynthetic protein FliR [Acetobacteraceae bacterium]